MTTHSLSKGTSLIAGLTSISRILGFVRDMIVAAIFGAGIISDAFFVALKIPNLLRSMVAEGALTSAFVPVFSDAKKESHQNATSLLRSMTGLLLLISCILALLGIIFSTEIVYFFAPGFKADTALFELCINLTEIMFPFIVFISVVALLNGALNSYAVYGAAPLAQIVMNLCLVGGALLAIPFDKLDGIRILAWSVVISGALQIAIQVPLVKKANLNFIPALPLFTAQTWQILKLMLPAIFGAAVYQLSMLINTMLASLLSAGSISWLFYADRISQLPVGIFIVALGSVLLPTLSSTWSEKNTPVFEKKLLDSMRFTSFLIIPTSVILIILAQPICELLFVRGHFTSYDAEQTARALQASSLGLWGIGISYLLMRAFIATKDTYTPTIIGILTLCLTLIFSLALMGPIKLDPNSITIIILHDLQNIFFIGNFGAAGLAISSGLAAVVSLPISFILLEKKACLKLNLYPFIRTTLILILASTLSIYFFDFIANYISASWLHLPWQILVIFIIFFMIAKLMNLSELAETVSLMKSKLNKNR